MHFFFSPHSIEGLLLMFLFLCLLVGCLLVGWLISWFACLLALLCVGVVAFVVVVVCFVF